jgi:ABC-2 type transport system ATP-binding protein
MINVENLTQVYSNGKGIFDLSFTVDKGEVFGYLGPNGAGKTTTIRNLLGFANATKGKVTINGINCRIGAEKLQNDIGYLPGEIAFFDNVTGMQFLKFIGEMRKTKDISLRDSLIDRLNIPASRKIRKMSKGMKQKLAIITAFMHDPAVYILDEPTSGLDPFIQNIFMEMIKEEKEKGKTIIMSSHIFEEVQKSCDRAGIIKEGHLVAIENINSLNVMKNNSYLVSFANQEDIKKIENSCFPIKKISDNKVEIQINSNYQDFFKLLSVCSITNLDKKQQTLEDIFMKYYGTTGKLNE